MRTWHALGISSLWLIFALWDGGLAAARPEASAGDSASDGDTKKAKQLYATGVSELVARDFSAAGKALSESYRLRPALETLYQLGMLANAQGRRLEAYDILRRYAADKGHGATAQGSIAYPHQAEVQRVLAITPEDTAELKVQGPAGTLLFVDGRVVGSLPLSLPLLLRSGSHILSAEQGTARQEVNVDIVVGRTGEVRFHAGGRAPTVSARAEAGVLVTLSTDGVSSEQRPFLRSTLTDFVTRAGLNVQHADAALLQHSDLNRCIRELPCKLELAKRGGQEHILAAHVSLQGAAAAGQWRVSVAWVQSTVGTSAAQADQGCPICAPEQAAVLLEEASKRVMQIGLQRASGRLQLRSTPAGAQVFEGEHSLGRTPIDVALYAGLHQIVLRQAGLRSRHTAVLIDSGKTQQLELDLLPGSDATSKGP